MNNYSESEQEKVKAGIEALNSFDYVVLSDFHNLPELIQGGDIDVFVHSDDYDDAIEELQSVGYQNILTKDFKENILNLFTMTMDNRRRVFSMVIKKPRSALSYLTKSLSMKDDTKSPHAEYNELKLNNAGVMIHMRNHLAYKSPQSGRLIRVDPEFEHSMLESRGTNGQGVCYPAAPEELIHLICRGVFDYEGDFPEYYIDRCQTLYNKIASDEVKSNRFDELLQLVFYDASVVVKKCVEENNYDSMTEFIVSFDSY